MTTANEVNIHKANDIKCKAQIYFSPDSSKKDHFLKLRLASKNIYQNIDSNLSKNQIKKKINSNLGKNIINFQQQNKFLKSSKKQLIETPDKFNKNKKSNKSYKKYNSKFYLKKNANRNISSFNETHEKKLSTQSNFFSNTNINSTPKVKNNNYEKNSLSNIKFNIGKSSHKLLNSKNPQIQLKRNVGSEIELLEAKTKNLSNLTNINPLDYIYTSGNKQNKFLSPNNQNSNPKIIFFNNEKNKTKDKYYNLNRKESNINQNQTKENEQNNTDKANVKDGEDKKNQINLLLKNTFTNVKIFPTTILNNKIIFNNPSEKSNQNKNNEQNQQNKNNENNINNSKIKKEKIVIETIDKKPNINKRESFNSIEELHYFYVDTLQKGKKIVNVLDK